MLVVTWVVLGKFTGFLRLDKLLIEESDCWSGQLVKGYL